MLDIHFAELLKKGAVAFIFRLTGAGLTFLLTVYLARILGTSNYGLFMLSLTLVTILSAGVRMGLDNVLVRHISAAVGANNFPLARGYFKVALRMVFIFALVITLLGIAFSPLVADRIFGKRELVQPLANMMWVLLPFSMVYLIAEALKGLAQVASSTIAQTIIIPGVSLMILFVGESWFDWRLLDVVNIYIASVCAAFLYAWRSWRLRIPKGEVIEPQSRDLLSSGFPLLLATSGGLILAWTDTLVLGIYESAGTVGIYSVASRTALLTSLILVAVNSIVAPKFAVFHAHNDLNAVAILARQATLLMTALVVFPTLLLLLWPEWILGLFGEEYVSGKSALMILALGQLVNVACGSVGYILMMSGHEITVRNIMLATAVINIGLNIVFVQFYGIEGVAVATAVSVVIWNAWMLLSIRKYLGFWPIYIPTKKAAQEGRGSETDN